MSGEEKEKLAIEEQEPETSIEEAQATEEINEEEVVAEETVEEQEVVEEPSTNEVVTAEVEEENIEEASETETDEEAKEEEPVAEEVTEESASEVEEVVAETPTEEITEEVVEASAVEEDEAGSSEDPDEPVAEGLAYYENLVAKAKELVSQTDWSFVTMELENIFFVWNDGPEVEGTGALYKQIEELRNDFHERKKAHYEELQSQREANLVKKKELLKEFTDIITEEKWSAAKDVSRIKGRWESIKFLPQGEAEALDEKFQKLVLEFEDHKVDRLVKKLQKEEENLIGKLAILDKMELLVSKIDDTVTDFTKEVAQFNELIRQWRKIGRVPNDKADASWDRFNAAQDKLLEARFKHDPKYRKEVERNLTKKKQLVEEAETLIDNENLAEAARRVNTLHKVWKKTGNLPQKDENELWDRFKAATDAFNERKSQNLDQLKDEEQQNLEAKLQLIKKAEALKEVESEDWNASHQQMQGLMDQWKKIGPVPRKRSGKVWKQFKEAMDSFYEQRRGHLKEVRGEQKDNLTRKREIIDKIRALAEHEDAAKAIEEVKQLQNEFKKIGFVPIKAKNKIWKQYREVCDIVYDRYRSIGSDLGMERKLAAKGIDPEARKEVIKRQKEMAALKKEVSKLQEEVLHYSDAITYFKPTKKGLGLQDEIQKKIDKAEEELVGKQNRLRELSKEIDDLSSSDD